MKFLIWASIFSSLISNSHAQNQQVVEISMEQLVQKVSTENYTVYESATRVYQAKESITVARKNLLPRLNIWKMASAALEIVAGGPAGIAAGSFSIIEDIAPFLVPANWYRVSQTKLFYEADKEGYKALWANEILTAKALYHHMLLDSALRDHIKQTKKDLQKILEIVKVRETFGGAPRSVSQDIKIRMLALDEDLRSLDVLLAEEESLLAYMMGYSTGVKLRVKPVQMPDFGALERLDYKDFEYRAVEVSPEIKQFEYFIEAANYVKKEISYAFLGTSSLSRGINGGIFDNIPMQAGLGFGTGASLRIARAQKDILKVQKKGVEETVKRNLKLLVDNYNLDIDNFHGMTKRVSLTKDVLDQLYKRAKFGDEIQSIELIEASRSHIDADTALFSVIFRFLNNEDKLSRLIFHGDYSKTPVSTVNF